MLFLCKNIKTLLQTYNKIKGLKVMDKFKHIKLNDKQLFKETKIEDIQKDMLVNPETYTVWFKIIFDEFYHFLEEHTI